MNFIWLHPPPVEKANNDSLLVAVEECENSKRKTFSVNKGAALRHEA
jgi:hypothetical protein